VVIAVVSKGDDGTLVTTRLGDGRCVEDKRRVEDIVRGVCFKWPQKRWAESESVPSRGIRVRLFYCN